MFYSLFSYTFIYKDNGFPTREHATHSCPYAKHRYSKFIPQTVIDVYREVWFARNQNILSFVFS